MKAFFADDRALVLPPGHRFPAEKYPLLRKALLGAVIPTAMLRPSPPVEEADLERAHAPAYARAIASGEIDATAMRRIGFPWSASLNTRARAVMGGAVAAARVALEDGFSGQLAGGTHHAHYDFGAGYCVFNDFAVAALAMIAEGRADRIAIIDLDVHQGDGNAAILGGREEVFVFSMHGEKNFPFRKVSSHLDVALPDGTGDDEYLRALAGALPAVWAFRPDLVLYQAGVDPLAEDRLGRLVLTHEGLKARDRMVLSECARRGVPVSIALGGGYADPIAASVAAYANTWVEAKAIFRF